VPDARFRAPHLLCLKFAGGIPAGLAEGLAADGIYVASRIGRLRVSPHVYNDETDADRFVAALAKRLRK
jgi:selenocysteine lyase/cysteine desulfurase